jgi:hypothetical protein
MTSFLKAGDLGPAKLTNAQIDRAARAADARTARTETAAAALAIHLSANAAAQEILRRLELDDDVTVELQGRVAGQVILATFRVLEDDDCF